MHLTNLTTRCSILLYGRLSENFARVRTTIWNRKSMFEVFVPASLARRFSMPALRIRESMGYETRFVPLHSMSFIDLRYCRYGFSRQQKASEALVPCHLAFDQSEIWGKRNGFATHTWLGQLSHSLDLVAQTPACYGTTRTRPPLGHG